MPIATNAPTAGNLAAYVALRRDEGEQPGEVRFTQREVRESLAWDDLALRRQLTRLVDWSMCSSTAPAAATSASTNSSMMGKPRTRARLLGLADPQRLVASGREEAGSQDESPSHEEASSTA